MAAPLAFKYGYASSLFALAQLDWLTCNPNAMLVTAGYAPSPNTDQFVSQVPPSAIIVRDQALTGVAQSNGVCTGIIPTFNALLAVNPAVAVIIYGKGANDAVSPLIYYSANGQGFPFIPQGFNYSVLYDATQGGWFKV